MNTGTIWAKTCLFISEPLVDMFLDPIKQYPSKDFVWYRQKCNIPPIIAVCCVTLLWYFISRPHLQLLGISPSFHIYSNRGCNMFALISKSTFSTSGEILSTPAAFPFLNSFSAVFISATVGALVLTLKFVSYSYSSPSFSSSAICLSKVEFKILAKCSCQRFCWSSACVRRVPSGCYDT